MRTPNSKMSSATPLIHMPSCWSLFAPPHYAAPPLRCSSLVAALLLLFGLVSMCAGAPTDGQRWSNGVGLWGKRSENMANLALFDGLFDEGRSMRKRPEQGWQKLNALWGKRSSNSNWQTANGLWGKRSAPPLQQMAEEDK